MAVKHVLLVLRTHAVCLTCTSVVKSHIRGLSLLFNNRLPDNKAVQPKILRNDFFWNNSQFCECLSRQPAFCYYVTRHMPQERKVHPSIDTTSRAL